MSTPIRSVDELCVAVQGVLDEHLADVMDALGFTGKAYDEVKSWQQLPTTTAISSADMPAGAISSAGLVSPPSHNRATGLTTATWRIAVGVYDRGRDHASTQAQVRNWCAGIRTTLLAHKSLGGRASTLAWAGEEYDLIPGREQARTIAAGAIAFDITASVDTSVPTGVLPVVLSTDSSVTARSPEE